MMTYLLGMVLISALNAGETSDIILKEDFSTFAAGKSLSKHESWKSFQGFPGKTKPQVVVHSLTPDEGGHVLAFSHNASFRADNYGLHIPIKNPIKSGVVWLQCRVRTPQEWTAGFFIDARSGRNVIARVAGATFAPKDQKPVLRWHLSWGRSYWRLYSKMPLKPNQWWTVTARLDFDRQTVAAWLNEQTLGEDVPMCASGPLTHLHISGGGTTKHPALLDDISLTRSAPKGRQLRALLPEPKKDHSFRFAVVGDPQLGFGGIEPDKLKFRQAVKQINESKAELTIVPGDMVHPKNEEDLYKSLKTLGEGLAGPVYYVRGNHERIDYYKKYFQKDLDYSFTHKGVRFVFIDAEGNHKGLTQEQLRWIESEFKLADTKKEEIVIVLHVSPWQKNERGRGKYNQIGKGRDELRALMKKYKVLLSLSGHYHRGLWHQREEETHYFVLPGTALVKIGRLGWCIFDVYPDRIEMIQKPLFFGWERTEAKTFYHFAAQRWEDYVDVKKKFPYLQQGPLIIQRHRPTTK